MKDQELEKLPPYLSWAPGNIGISCTGTNAVDRSLIKSMEYGPAGGIDTVCLTASVVLLFDCSYISI